MLIDKILTIKYLHNVHQISDFANFLMKKFAFCSNINLLVDLFMLSYLSDTMNKQENT